LYFLFLFIFICYVTLTLSLNSDKMHLNYCSVKKLLGTDILTVMSAMHLLSKRIRTEIPSNFLRRFS